VCSLFCFFFFSSAASPRRSPLPEPLPPPLHTPTNSKRLSRVTYCPLRKGQVGFTNAAEAQACN